MFMHVAIGIHGNDIRCSIEHKALLHVYKPHSLQCQYATPPASNCVLRHILLAPTLWGPMGIQTALFPCCRHMMSWHGILTKAETNALAPLPSSWQVRGPGVGRLLGSLDLLITHLDAKHSPCRNWIHLTVQMHWIYGWANLPNQINAWFSVQPKGPKPDLNWTLASLGDGEMRPAVLSLWICVICWFMSLAATVRNSSGWAQVVEDVASAHTLCLTWPSKSLFWAGGVLWGWTEFWVRLSTGHG